MWPRSLVFLLLVYKHTTSQPITDDSTNDRPTRQLNFKDCCPCIDDVNNDSVPEEPLGAGSENVFSSLRDVDDCPCRPRSADSEGASSVFFPTAMRAAGSFLRPSDKIEDMKPLFNPEVDLASSVLETLREVTDEEYQDALARDAAKSAARTAEDFVFGDTTPQESANVVTIVVNPRRSVTDDDDDALPDASHVQQTRCISPLQSTRSSPGKMRIAPKSILHKTRQPKLKNRLLHRNFYDMDNGMSASNVKERIASIDGENGSGASPLRVLESTNRLVGPNAGTDNCNRGEISDVPSNLEKTSRKGLNVGQLSLFNNIRDKTMNSLSRLPKLNLKNLITDSFHTNKGDLSSAPSTVHEQGSKMVSYLRNNLQSKPKMPLSIPNLLNLRDVEVIPLKDLIANQAKNDKRNRSKLGLTPIFNRHDTEIKSNRDTSDATLRDNTQLTLKNNADDTEVSPSVVNMRVSPIDEQISSKNCDGELSEKNANIIEDNVKPISTEIIETTPANKQEMSLETITETNDCLNGENENQDTMTGASNDMNSAKQPETLEVDNFKSSADAIEVFNESCDQEEEMKDNPTKPKLKLLDSNAVDKTLSNIKENIAKRLEDFKNSSKQPETLEVDNFKSSADAIEVLNESCDQEEEMKVNPTKPKLKLLDSSAVDKTLSNIKENIVKKLEDFKNKTSLKNIKILQKTANGDEEIPIENNANQGEDCENVASVQITTLATQTSHRDSEDIFMTLKPDTVEQTENNRNSRNENILGDEAEETTECFDKAVTMQDLQKISDSILEQEERERESKPLESSKSSEEMMKQSENKNQNVDQLNLDEPADTTLDDIEDPNNLLNIPKRETDDVACKSDLASGKTTMQLPSDSNVEASDLIPNVVPNDNDILSSPPILQPTLTFLKKSLPDISDVVKLSPLNSLPTLDDIKERLTGLFDSDNREAEVISNIDTVNEPKMSETSNPVMATDASKSFYTRLPPTKHLEEVNFDILELKPQSSKLPKIGLHSFKTKLPLPKDINLKPLKLQSALENKHGLLGTSLSIGKVHDPFNIFNNPLKIRPSFNKDNDRFDLPLEPSNIHLSLKNAHKALEAKLRKATKSNFNLKRPYESENLLETISRNHEDINDKLKGLHADFNDRLETMRNDLLDRSKLLTSSHNFQPHFRSSSKLNKLQKNKKPLHHRREPQKSSASHKPVKKPVKTNTKLSNIQQKLRMPAAASVPVPKTVQVPDLRTTPEKSLPLVSSRTPNMSSYRNADARPTSQLVRQSSAVVGKHTKPMNQKAKLYFSTTLKPDLMNTRFRSSLPRDQKNKNGIGQNHFRSKIIHRDNDDSPSEIIKTKMAVPTSGNINERKLSQLEMDDPSRNVQSVRFHVKMSDVADNSKYNGLRSWPRVDDSLFLKKVKEAVQTRLTKINSVKTLKQGSPPESQLDMARSASENIETINGPTPLKENVSYKCKMVCTKD